MPRKPKPKLAQPPQVYNLPQYGPHARVTIEYDVNDPPPFFQPAAGVVIVGEHVCGYIGQVHAPYVATPEPLQPRGGNLMDASSPEYLERAAALRRGDTAPPGYSPKVVTSEQVFAEAGISVGGQLDVDSLRMAAAMSEPADEVT